MHVLIATPTTSGTVMAAYAQTLIAATQAISEKGGSYRLLTVDGADVVVARNALAHQVLAEAECTHILFIDSDMAVDSVALRHLLSLDAPFAGTAYTERHMDLQRLTNAMAEEPDMARARALASNFALRMEPGKKKVSNQMVELDAVGFGCVLIRRTVFEALIEQKIVSPFTSTTLRMAGLKGDIWDFFGQIEQTGGDRLSEDYSFCHRVRQLGTVPVIAYVGPGVGHVGPFMYGAPYIERLKAGKT
ncbi:MAG: hypothetical protein AAF367_01935 [Pseudomonadota bacterium]